MEARRNELFENGAVADPHGRDMGILPRDHARLFVGGLEFFFWEGMFCRHMADRYVVVPAPVGAVVTEIPSGAPAVVVDGTPYYTVNGVTYMRTSYGYQVVQPPSVIAPVSNVSTPAAPNVVVGAPTAPLGTSTNADNSFIVNIPNSKGEYTPVTLRRAGNGFFGPQGEYYTEFPRIEQLKVMYAK